jgi:ubiquinone/menaquinone biosynthesis C-methylase UbiE
MTEDKLTLEKAYDGIAEKYLISRSSGKTRCGFKNRVGEQPTMFETVPRELQGKKLLDLGCGPGIHAKEYCARGAEVIGVDISEEMIKIAKEQAPKATFLKADLLKIPFPNNHFDIITSSYVLDHIEDLNYAATEILRVLKDNGEFIFTIPHPIINMFRDEKEGKYIPSHYYFDTHFKYFNIGETGKIFKSYPRTLEDLFRPFLSSGMILVDFKENKPNTSWREEYENFDENLLRVPFLCCFRWKKK